MSDQQSPEYIEFRTEAQLFMRDGRELFEQLRAATQDQHATMLVMTERVGALDERVEKNEGKIAIHDRIMYGGAGVLAFVGVVAKAWPWLNSLLH